MIERATITDRQPVPLLTKLNPLWWLVGPDGWQVPDINNGEPYLPDVTNVWLRRFYWFICRNPLMNFVGYVLGVEDKNYTVVGTAPVLLTTLRDAVPPRNGWKWAVIVAPFSIGALNMACIFGWLAWLGLWPLWVACAIALLKVVGPLPFISYNRIGGVEFYWGWRPHSGGLGFKLVWHRQEG